MPVCAAAHLLLGIMEDEAGSGHRVSKVDGYILQQDTALRIEEQPDAADDNGLFGGRRFGGDSNVRRQARTSPGRYR